MTKQVYIVSVRAPDRDGQRPIIGPMRPEDGEARIVKCWRIAGVFSLESEANTCAALHAEKTKVQKHILEVVDADWWLTATINEYGASHD